MSGRCRKFIVFSLHDSLYALDLQQVAEVGDPPQLWPIPAAPPCYCGALNFHGDIVAALDLQLFLGVSGGLNKIIVLHPDIAALAFLVNSVVRIISEDEVTFSTVQNIPFAAGRLTFADGEAIQLDLEAVVHSAESRMAGLE
jgi:chemotaxis signal transduction protein